MTIKYTHPLHSNCVPAPRAHVYYPLLSVTASYHCDAALTERLPLHQGLNVYEDTKAFVQKLVAEGRQEEKKVYVLPAFEIDGSDQTVPETFEQV